MQLCKVVGIQESLMPKTIQQFNVSNYYSIIPVQLWLSPPSLYPFRQLHCTPVDVFVQMCPQPPLFKLQAVCVFVCVCVCVCVCVLCMHVCMCVYCMCAHAWPFASLIQLTSSACASITVEYESRATGAYE